MTYLDTEGSNRKTDARFGFSGSGLPIKLHFLMKKKIFFKKSILGGFSIRVPKKVFCMENKVLWKKKFFLWKNKSIEKKDFSMEK